MLSTPFKHTYSGFRYCSCSAMMDDSKNELFEFRNLNVHKIYSKIEYEIIAILFLLFYVVLDLL